MIDFIYLILCILSFININIKGFNSFYNDYMLLENTSSIKGIFVWMIFFRHYTGYLNKQKTNNKISISIDRALDQNIVSLFLFYSGYGINESYKKKGKSYIKTLPVKSLVLFLKAQIALLLFLLNNLLLGIKTSLKKYALAIIFKSGIGNSFWFTFTIIMLYLYSFLSFHFIIKMKLYNFFGIIIINIICYIHIIIVYNYYHQRQIFSVDTIICFIIGLYYSFFKSKLERLIMKNDINYYGILIIFSIGYYNYHIALREIIFNIFLKNALFTIVVILITMKIRFKNEYLNLLNKHSFSIYLLQRVIIIFINSMKYFEKNEFIRFFIDYLLVILISKIFDKYTGFINRLLNYKKIEMQYKKEINNKTLLEEKKVLIQIK